HLPLDGLAHFGQLAVKEGIAASHCLLVRPSERRKFTWQARSRLLRGDAREIAVEDGHRARERLQAVAARRRSRRARGTHQMVARLEKAWRAREQLVALGTVTHKLKGHFARVRCAT